MKSNLSDKTKELIYRWKQSGDKEARELIIKSNELLVHSIIKRFKKSLDYDDLYQLGMIGLIKAVDRFDPTREVKFSTYAVPLIIGEIKTFLRENTSIKFTRSTKEIGKKVKKTQEELAKCFNRSPTLEEIAKELNITREEVAAAMEVEKPLVSLESDIQYSSNGNEKMLKEKVLPENSLKKEEKQLDLLELLEVLDQKERTLIKMRYLEDKSQREVGEYFGINQVNISRWEKKVMRKLREVLE